MCISVGGGPESYYNMKTNITNISQPSLFYGESVYPMSTENII